MRNFLASLGPVGRRLAVGVGANALGKVWVAIVQLASIPILAGAWGADRFGLWLMIITVPTYIALTSTGFNAVAGVEIARSYVNQRIEACRTTYQSVWALITVASGGLLLFGLLVRVAMASTGRDEWALGQWEVGDASTTMLIYAFVAIQSAIVLSVYRGVARYAEGTVLYDLIGLAEGLAVISIVLAGGGLFAASGVMVVIRVIGLIGLHLHITKREPWAQLGTSAAKVTEVHRLLNPSLGALTIAGANALSIQGVVVALGIAAGPAATAAFVSARTLARLPLQLSDLLGRASLPEMAQAWFAPDHPLFWRLTVLNVAFALWILVPCSLIALLFGTEIAVWVSRGHISYEPWLVAALVLGVLVQGFSMTLGHSIAAQNRQHSYGYVYLFISFIMALIPFLSKYSENPATATAIGVFLCEGIGLIIVAKSVFYPLVRTDIDEKTHERPGD